LDIIDRNIIELLKNGDLTAFDKVYRKYCRKLSGFVYHIVKTETDTEEIVQDVFVKLWNSREKLQPTKSFDAYLYTIAYNTTISMVRKRISEKKYIDHILMMQQDVSFPESIDKLQFEQLFDQMYKIINQLPARQKEVFLLNREKGMTYKEIAEQLNISENTVEIHMVKALRFLQNKINGKLLLGLLVISIYFM